MYNTTHGDLMEYKYRKLHISVLLRTKYRPMNSVFFEIILFGKSSNCFSVCFNECITENKQNILKLIICIIKIFLHKKKF